MCEGRFPPPLIPWNWEEERVGNGGGVLFRPFMACTAVPTACWSVDTLLCKQAGCVCVDLCRGGVSIHFITILLSVNIMKLKHTDSHDTSSTCYTYIAILNMLIWDIIQVAQNNSWLLMKAMKFPIRHNSTLQHEAQLLLPARWRLFSYNCFIPLIQQQFLNDHNISFINSRHPVLFIHLYICKTS